MGFIQKNDPVVLNIKLTSTGRDQLAKGQLKFNSFVIGDSEIDYSFNSANNFNPFLANILKPADNNPNILSFVPRVLSGTPYNSLNTISSIPTIIQNTTNIYGFFSNITGNTYTILTDPNHVKQPDTMVKINTILGGKQLSLYQSPTYQSYPVEPQVNDYLFIKWTNPNGINTTGYTLNVNKVMPCLWYKISKVYAGTSLQNNNLVVDVDRELPNFNGQGNKVAGAMIFKNQNTATGYTVGFDSNNVFSFLENCESTTTEYPFWNMSIIFTEELAGVQNSNRNFGQFTTGTYAGFVSYIQNQAPDIKKIGVIHYSNNSPSNTYGESLYLNSPKLFIPTIMWHNETGNTMGVVLSAYGDQKILTGNTLSLNTVYYDLADKYGNVVGKIFNDLQLFTIEDQELLFAMSYKSNRSWTLPEPVALINSSLSVGNCTCNLFAIVTGITPTTSSSFDGGFFVKVTSSSGAPVFIEVLKSTNSQPTIILYTGGTSGMYIKQFNVGSYTVNVFDTGASNCFQTNTFTFIATTYVDAYNIVFTNTQIT